MIEKILQFKTRLLRKLFANSEFVHESMSEAYDIGYQSALRRKVEIIQLVVQFVRHAKNCDTCKSIFTLLCEDGLKSAVKILYLSHNRFYTGIPDQEP